MRTRRQNRPGHTGRGGRQISDRVSLCALPLDALRGVLEHDAGGLELVADAVSLGPVLGLAGGLTRGDLLLDGLCLGVLAAVGAERDAQHVAQLEEAVEARLRQRLARVGGGGDGGVDLAHHLEDDGDRVGGVEVVVHDGVELLAVLVQPLYEGGVRLAQLTVAPVGDEELEVALGGAQALERGLGLHEDLAGVVERAAVVAHEHEHADAVITVDGGGLAHGEEVAERLAHLLVVDVDKAVVQPVVDEFAAVGGLGLRDLVLVVREGEVAAAAVDVDRLA